jgi:hypothetical protein
MISLPLTEELSKNAEAVTLLLNVADDPDKALLTKAMVVPSSVIPLSPTDVVVTNLATVLTVPEPVIVPTP